MLHVIHDHGGGTETHVRALIAGSRERWRHYLAIAVGDRWQVEEHRADGTRRHVRSRRAATDEPWRDFVGGICATFGIALVHLHNISACRDGILTALASLAGALRLHGARPQLRVPDDHVSRAPTACTAARRPIPRSARAASPRSRRSTASTSWRGATRHRALLRGAAFLIAPSQWAADTLARYFPECPATRDRARFAGRRAARAPGVRTTVMLPDDDVPTVAVLGAIGPDKGARRLERLVAARARSAARACASC